jgi:hypothetical protein
MAQPPSNQHYSISGAGFPREVSLDSVPSLPKVLHGVTPRLVVTPVFIRSPSDSMQRLPLCLKCLRCLQGDCSLIEPQLKRMSLEAATSAGRPCDPMTASSHSSRPMPLRNQSPSALRQKANTFDCVLPRCLMSNFCLCLHSPSHVSQLRPRTQSTSRFPISPLQFDDQE